MKTMKLYKEPETKEVLLLSEMVMKVAGDASLPQSVAAGGFAPESGMYDGNKRRQL